ncbi:MAG: class B sortase [Clostridia bacterium]|nr:class B sortase [Clostridia bacterium]
MSNKRKTVFILLLLIAAIGLGVVVYTLTSSYLNKKQYVDLKEQVWTSETTTEATTVVATSTNEPTDTIPEETKEPYVSPIDFDTLHDTNSDIFAWLDIPDTDISYPVLQRADDFEYYLRRGLDEQYSNDGSLFIEPIHNIDMSSYNTIIYGHNLRSLGMFGTLKYYRDLTYLEEHREIKVYTPTGEYTYYVFAAVTYNDRLITALFDFDQAEGRQAFLDSLDDINDMNSYILDDVEVTSEDKLLTLSTCNSDKSQRFLVVAVLTDVKE